jgi:hypothetical protein
LIDVCDAASNRAIATHQTQTLRIDEKSGRFAVRAKAQEVDERDATFTEGELDQRIALIIREPKRDAETEEMETETAATTQLDTISFYPDGSADAREFLLRDRAGVELALRINPASSRVRIIEMAAQ